MKKVLKVCALLLAVSLLATAFVGCKKKDEYKGADTLVVGYDKFSGKFSPFFATTAYDQDVVGMTTLGLISTDREGNVVYKGIEGEKRTYNGTEYTYKGISDVTETINSDGTVDYDIKIKKGVKFSDGKELTADDVIFTMYVYSDPAYTGSTTFSAQPIEGMADYLKNMTTKSSLILADGPDKASDYYTADESKAYFEAFNKAGVKFAQTIVDYVIKNYVDDYAGAIGKTADEIKGNDGLKVALGMRMWGFASYKDDVFTSAAGTVYDLVNSFPTTEDYWTVILDSYGYDISDKGINYEKADTNISDLIDAELGDKADVYAVAVKTGDTADSISGIKKVNDYEVAVKMTKFDATAIYQLGIYVTPLHYYGDESMYDYDNNKFGFTKGDLTAVKAKTKAPMGAGPYVFQSYENGVVTFKRNENYYKGTPKITYVKFQETGSADKVPGVVSGSFDVTDPSFNDAAVKAIKEANNGELNGQKIVTNTVDNLGYGYIGANATTVNVGGDPDSDESKALRKAFATLFAVYRDKTIYSYYGERASVIQYPISNTSWAAPKPNDEGYELAYSKDVDGNSIYTSSMTEEEKYAAALEAAIGFLKKAGYTWDDAAKKFTAAPEGAKMEYEAIVPGDGIGDHPAYNILTETKKALETIGITLTINDPSDSQILWDALDAGTQNFWTAAWGAAVDPDMYQIYHSSNVVGVEGSSESNHYRIQDATLDELIMKARESADHAYRKAIYKQCLDIIMDWGVEIPTYQRQNAIIFSPERVNMKTVTPDITTFWGWMNDVELLEMNPVAE